MGLRVAEAEEAEYGRFPVGGNVIKASLSEVGDGLLACLLNIYDGLFVDELYEVK